MRSVLGIVVTCVYNVYVASKGFLGGVVDGFFAVGAQSEQMLALVHTLIRSSRIPLKLVGKLKGLVCYCEPFSGYCFHHKLLSPLGCVVRLLPCAKKHPWAGERGSEGDAAWVSGEAFIWRSGGWPCFLGAACVCTR